MDSLGYYEYKWELLQTLSGESSNNYFGNSVSFNYNGDIMAIGAYNYNSKGGVYIYKRNNTTNIYQQLGQTISYQNNGDLTGWSVSLNQTGNIVAIGSPGYDVSGISNSGLVRVYKYNDLTTLWEQYGQDICGNQVNENTGYSTVLSINSEGNILCVGYPGFRQEDNKIGLVRTYIYNELSTEWVQLGQDIYGIYENGIFLSVNNNLNGNILSISQSNNNSEGLVKVYKYNDLITQWEQYGQDLSGSNVVVDFYGTSTSLNNDGNIIAIGGLNNGDDYGYVDIYRYNNNTNTWVRDERLIETEKGTDFGSSVKLNGVGDRLIVGAPQNNIPTNTDIGKIITYKYNASIQKWEKYGQQLNGIGNNSYYGLFVSSNNRGNIISVSMNNYDDNSGYKGLVKIYYLTERYIRRRFFGLDFTKLEKKGLTKYVGSVYSLLGNRKR